MDQAKATKAIVTVGTGRGFVVTDPRDPSGPYLVITAAHCLNCLPRASTNLHPEERTYEALLARLGDTPTIWAECLFAAPVGDIAVLGQPDNQAFQDQADRYLHHLMKGAEPLWVADAPEHGRAWLLSLDEKWFQCSVEHSCGALCLDNADGYMVPGMSGSPIVADNGRAIGVVCTDSEGPHPRLAYNLPMWFAPRHNVLVSFFAKLFKRTR